MAHYLFSLLLLFALTGPSRATYCLCRDGVSSTQLQRSIDYACGQGGADCSPILQNGPCYNPNTVRDHCNYAVNSYYQRRGQATGSCDFAGAATVSQTPPSSQSSSCVYPSSPSNAGTNTSGTGTGTGSSTTPVFGLGPTGSGGITTPEGSDAAILVTITNTLLLLASLLIFMLFRL